MGKTKRQMKPEEKSAENFLKSVSKGKIVYEPDGNVTPDFSIDGTTAVEVRRLNENYFGPDRTAGLEQAYFATLKQFRRILASFEPKYDGHTYWVGLSYKRPIPKSFRSDVQNALTEFLSGHRTALYNIDIGHGLSLDILPGTAVPTRVFRHGLEVDDDSGGLVHELYSKNISHCIAEKDTKIADRRDRYSSWWLVLVDTMMMFDGLMPDEVGLVKAGIKSRKSFDKVIVIEHQGKREFVRWE